MEDELITIKKEANSFQRSINFSHSQVYQLDYLNSITYGTNYAIKSKEKSLT